MSSATYAFDSVEGVGAVVVAADADATFGGLYIAFELLGGLALLGGMRREGQEGCGETANEEYKTDSGGDARPKAQLNPRVGSRSRGSWLSMTPRGPLSSEVKR